MKNCVYKNYWGELSIIGYLEDALWKATSDCSGPRRSGVFLIADGKGNTGRMKCATGGEDVTSLFDDIVRSRCYESVRIYNGAEYREPTNDDLIRLYTNWNVWYDEDYCADETSLTIYEGDAIPKYFLDTEFKGPIDSEIDSNESVQVDCNLKPV